MRAITVASAPLPQPRGQHLCMIGQWPYTAGPCLDDKQVGNLLLGEWLGEYTFIMFPLCSFSSLYPAPTFASLSIVKQAVRHGGPVVHGTHLDSCNTPTCWHCCCPLTWTPEVGGTYPLPCLAPHNSLLVQHTDDTVSKETQYLWRR